MESYKKVVDKITNFLFKSQVIADNQTIALSKGKGELKTRLIRGDKLEYKYYIKKSKSSILVSLDKKFVKQNEIKVGEFFRTDFADYVGNTVTKVTKIKHVSKKLKAVSGIHTLLYRVITYFLRTGRFNELPNLIRFFHSELYRQKSGDLSNVPGITWKLVSLSNDKAVLQCCDSGGIYDRYINDEGTHYPPQVPGDYYADAYSAYCFAKQYLDTKDEVYLDASLRAIDFVIRNYDDYKPTRIVWPHKDFKNLPIIETYEMLLGKISKDKLQHVERFIKRMNENFYESTNVFALKYSWHFLRESLGFPESKSRMRYCVRRIAAEQTKSGLIMDNFYIHHDSRDLTYHLYALAFLANVINKGCLDSLDIFLKGAKFSMNLTSPDGEVSYLGRGANNIYQISAAIYIFETAAKLSNSKEAKQFKRAASLVFKNLSKWQTKEGYFPNSLNNYGHLRLAWNHCETPYNAQSAYFLIKAGSISAKLEQSDIPLEKSDTLIDFLDSGYLAASLKKYFLVLFTGTSKSFAWSGGKHINGLPGIALLGSKKAGTFSLILDEAKDSIPVTDLPSSELKSLYGKGKLQVISEKPLIILYSKKSIEKYYICMPEALIQISKTNRRSKIRNVFSSERIPWKIRDNVLESDEIRVNSLSDSYRVYKSDIPNPRGIKSVVVESSILPHSCSATIIYFDKKYNIDEFVRKIANSKVDSELIAEKFRALMK